MGTSAFTQSGLTIIPILAGRFTFLGRPVSAGSIKNVQNIKPCFSLRKNRA
ncbi:hypothetical protein D1BOALGB6SA_6402 [Olavius sp. associated proteobacterium Delta 1]|nr:hypothetical protein D1BOALGB6SA_6402 [Olavius sp. associated proteobacterium Delta 1]